MKPRILAIAVVILLALLAATLAWKYLAIGPSGISRDGAGSGEVSIGGPFSLTNQDGKTVSDADYRGRFMLVYFGFTFCPDICPTDLLIMSQTMKLLGDDAKQVAPIFISIDPARDTVAQLKDYLSNFNPPVEGLTGSQAAIDAVVKEYKVYARKVENPKGDYTMDHSAFMYLMDKNGKYVTHFAHNTPPEDMAVAIRKHIKE